jgi:putative SOS response-associated peptidase YedK
MCFHSKQSKADTQVENRFKGKIDNRSLFQPQESINGFEYPLNPVIIDEKPEIITHYNWGLIPTWSKEDTIKKIHA